jgi:hypothetical protein
VSINAEVLGMFPVGNSTLEQVPDDVLTDVRHDLNEPAKCRGERIDRALALFPRNVFLDRRKVFGFHRSPGQGADGHAQEVGKDLITAARGRGDAIEDLHEFLGLPVSELFFRRALAV